MAFAFCSKFAIGVNPFFRLVRGMKGQGDSFSSLVFFCPRRNAIGNCQKKTLSGFRVFSGSLTIMKRYIDN